jgi:uncharacterized protein YcbK (DUF882 family)
VLSGKARLKSCAFMASRTGACCGFAAVLLLFGSESLQDAVADGDTRTISMRHIHTHENITVTFKRDGRYDEAALRQLNYFLRDWRRNEEIKIDPHLIDLVWEVNREAGHGKPIWVVCGYRAPQTNAMLRRRSGGVARLSQHMVGRALDFYVPGAALEDIRVAGLRLQRGGVGYYPSSGAPFVHLDIGSVRHWPRMTHDQLVRVFPNGRTVHIPSDGKPLAGYALALADVSKRGNRPSGTSIEAARNSGVSVETVLASAERPARNPLAKLFGFGRNDDEEADSAEAATAANVTPATPSSRKPVATPAVVARLDRADKKDAAVPARTVTPERPKPVQAAAVAVTPNPLQIASIPVLPRDRPAHLDAPARPAQAASLVAAVPTANDVIATRGYWQGLPDGMTSAQPAGLDTANAPAGRVLLARAQTASAERDLTGTIGPWRVAPRDRVPPDLALAYAAQPRPEPPVRAMPMGAATTRMIAQSDTTVALRRSAARAIAAASAHASSAPARADAQYDDPWLRAVVVSPSVQRYLSITLLGPRDYRRLVPMMRKPDNAVMMTFSHDPHLGLHHQRFSGSAVVFVSTVTFPTRTAALQ